MSFSFSRNTTVANEFDNDLAFLSNYQASNAWASEFDNVHTPKGGNHPKRKKLIPGDVKKQLYMEPLDIAQEQQKAEIMSKSPGAIMNPNLSADSCKNTRLKIYEAKHNFHPSAKDLRITNNKKVVNTALRTSQPIVKPKQPQACTGSERNMTHNLCHVDKDEETEAAVGAMGKRSTTATSSNCLVDDYADGYTSELFPASIRNTRVYADSGKKETHPSKFKKVTVPISCDIYEDLSSDESQSGSLSNEKKRKSTDAQKIRKMTEKNGATTHFASNHNTKSTIQCYPSEEDSRINCQHRQNNHIVNFDAKEDDKCKDNITYECSDENAVVEVSEVNRNKIRESIPRPNQNLGHGVFIAHHVVSDRVTNTARTSHKPINDKKSGEVLSSKGRNWMEISEWRECEEATRSNNPSKDNSWSLGDLSRRETASGASTKKSLSFPKANNIGRVQPVRIKPGCSLSPTDIPVLPLSISSVIESIDSSSLSSSYQCNMISKRQSVNKESDDEWIEKPEKSGKKNRGSETVTPRNIQDRRKRPRSTPTSGQKELQSRRSYSLRRAKQNDVIDILDSDEDTKDTIIDTWTGFEARPFTQGVRRTPRFAERKNIDAVRIAIGRKVFSSSCQFFFQPGGKLQFLGLRYKMGHDSTVEEIEHKIFFDSDTSIQKLRYYIAPEETDVNNSNDNHEEVSVDDDTDDLMSFIALRITPNDSNRLNMYGNAYLNDEQLEDSTNSGDQSYIVIEFRNNEELMTLLDLMKQNPFLHKHFDCFAQLPLSELKTYSAALIADNKYDKETRLKSLKHLTSANFVRLVYPFNAASDVIEDAARGLNEARSILTITDKYPRNDQYVVGGSFELDGQEKILRAHYLTIRDEDFRRLNFDEFLNDTLVDFWMQWISRSERLIRSDVHFFTSHFFSTLDKDGPNGVSSWTAKKDINIFEKKFVFIPINEKLHWSLCVVVNPGKISNGLVADDAEKENQALPCILFFDSLKAHRKHKVGKMIRQWLNFESKRLELFTDKFHGDPFNATSMHLYDPKIPYQDNSWDCGVFVCRYAFGLMMIGRKSFTFRDGHDNFKSLITDSDAFQFSMVDIVRLRQEIKILIENLSSVYAKFRAEESTQEGKLREDEKKSLAQY